MKVRYTSSSTTDGSGGFTVATGNATLLSFSLKAAGFAKSYAKTPLTGYNADPSNVKLSGTFGLELNATGGPGKTSYSGGQLTAKSAQFRWFAENLHCKEYAGATCDYNATPTASSPGSGSAINTGFLQLGATATPKPGTLSHPNPIYGGPTSANGFLGYVLRTDDNFGYTAFLTGHGTNNEVPFMHIKGREIARTPEPGSLLLLGSGLAGLAALGGTGGLVGRLRRRG